MTLKDQSFCQQFQSFVCVPPRRRGTFKFWEMLKNASEVTFVPKNNFSPKNFELCAKFCGVQGKPGWRYLRFCASRALTLYTFLNRLNTDVSLMRLTKRVIYSRHCNCKWSNKAGCVWFAVTSYLLMRDRVDSSLLDIRNDAPSGLDWGLGNKRCWR